MLTFDKNVSLYLDIEFNGFDEIIENPSDENIDVSLETCILTVKNIVKYLDSDQRRNLAYSKQKFYT